METIETILSQIRCKRYFGRKEFLKKKSLHDTLQEYFHEDDFKGLFGKLEVAKLPSFDSFELKPLKPLSLEIKEL